MMYVAIATVVYFAALKVYCIILINKNRIEG